MTLDMEKNQINKPLLLTTALILFTVFFNIAMTITTSIYSYNIANSVVSAFAG